MPTIFYEIAGWLGTISYIIAYLFLSLGKLKAEHALYHYLNLVGAVGLIINSLFYRNYPSVFVNIAWLFIALLTIAVIIRKKYRPSDEAIE